MSGAVAVRPDKYQSTLKRLLGTKLTYSEISTLLGLSKEVIRADIRKYNLQDYRIEFDDTLMLSTLKRAQSSSFGIMERIRDDLSRPEVLGTLPPNTKINLYKTLAITGGIFFDKQRLLEGKSTGNLSIRTIRQELGDKKAELLKVIDKRLEVEGVQQTL